VTRLGDVWRAAKIETHSGYVRLLVERDGKLVSFYESKNPKTINQAKAQVGMAPSSCIPVADGSYVLIDAIASVEITRKDGVEAWVLRGISAELGTVTESKAIEWVKGHIGSH
jgi:hypothetical protein